MSWVVLLEPDTWLIWHGRAGTSPDRDQAARFLTRRQAARALDFAREFAPFPQARLLREDKPMPKLHIHVPEAEFCPFLQRLPTWLGLPAVCTAISTHGRLTDCCGAGEPGCPLVGGVEVQFSETLKCPHCAHIRGHADGKVCGHCRGWEDL